MNNITLLDFLNKHSPKGTTKIVDWMLLDDFLADNSQKKAADIISHTPGAVWQMIRDGRLMLLVTKEDGDTGHVEVKFKG